ncbi:MAG: hypothetical protein AB8G99_22225 [Planctomycetaceae bacterium]
MPEARDPKLDQFYANAPFRHPSWPEFQKRMAACGFSAHLIREAWGVIMRGLDPQAEIRRFPRDERRSNPHFALLVKMFETHLLHDAGKSLALWSGGIGVSRYARKQGHTPLEDTTLGKVIDNLALHNTWSFAGGLWNAVSKAFVRYPSPEVHIYVRAWDPASVLMRQEVPGLHEYISLHPTDKLKLRWHALFTPQRKDEAGGVIKMTEAEEVEATREITPAGDLVQESYIYPNRDSCVAALIRYLVYMNEDKDNPALTKQKQRSVQVEEELWRKMLRA